MSFNVQVVNEYFLDQAKRERTLTEEVSRLEGTIKTAKAELTRHEARLTKARESLRIVREKNKPLREIPSVKEIFEADTRALQPHQSPAESEDSFEQLVSSTEQSRTKARYGNEVIDERYRHIFQYDGKWTEFACNICGANARLLSGTKAPIYYNGAHGFYGHIKFRHCDGEVPSKADALRRCIRRTLSNQDVDLIRSGQNPIFPVRAVTLWDPDLVLDNDASSSSAATKHSASASSEPRAQPCAPAGLGATSIPMHISNRAVFGPTKTSSASNKKRSAADIDPNPDGEAEHAHVNSSKRRHRATPPASRHTMAGLFHQPQVAYDEDDEEPDIIKQDLRDDQY